GVVFGSNEAFVIEDYSKVEDFLEEYSGQTIASYVSGCGLFNQTYEDKYEEIINNFVTECYKEVLSEIDEKHLIALLLEHGYEVIEEEKNEIIETVTFAGIIDEPFLFHYELLDRIKACDFKFMFLLGRDQAIKKHTSNLAEEKKERERINAESEVAQQLWSRIGERFQLQNKHSLQKIEMKDYSSFVQFLDNHGVTKEEKILLAKYKGNMLSNKVCMKLMTEH
ncbi:MAG: hypothetical protein K0Q59_5447, partial [Paenibacillus sp.]|nr:hypothetical protein [Paenibacillus sp.]